MQFELFKCPVPGCGYRECSPVLTGEMPACPDCRSKLVVMTDPEERDAFDKELKEMFGNLVNGIPPARRRR